ncbi:L-selectin-like [Triplophysa rosa]|uniref:Secretory phospholipase A2 receptor-like n=1 Tax=Triplophysa rosa TaxID=992332 RepID=A0A9W7WV50_TRIRA|nr:L-selectin-like [Triplophysa rosa]KAI7808771.1 putative secretory phospholipase A2 receptor-like [Triplophysa rosa]
MKTTLTVLLIIQLYGLASCAIKQHYFIDQMKTWDEAQQYCRTNYHDLSTFINEIEEHQFKKDSDAQTSRAWVGLYKQPGTWTWATGEVATQISWDDEEPGNDFCAFIEKNHMKLHDDVCTTPHTFFCMYESVNTVTVQQSESWEGALEYCRHHHDDLASLSSSRSMTDALSKITGAQTQYVWIGLRFLAGGWFWISGDDLILNVWSSAGPPQCPAQNQHCAALDKNTKTWTPRDCEEKLNFLCF